ncbi:hypothetical protein COX25_02170 [bacterium (Candidatus Howlettbacteria) CG23_combo_of_CG06-09_8_20_14_all_37_9]|nr:MAG: hypothetical protein COX25_02170 [bacterium (Candidatus Howlettbacteria) CG23_combo_of_CG06-09_8_20_14_all_37_9]
MRPKKNSDRILKRRLVDTMEMKVISSCKLEVLRRIYSGRVIIEDHTFRYEMLEPFGDMILRIYNERKNSKYYEVNFRSSSAGELKEKAKMQSKPMQSIIETFVQSISSAIEQVQEKYNEDREKYNEIARKASENNATLYISVDGITMNWKIRTPQKYQNVQKLLSQSSILPAKYH